METTSRCANSTPDSPNEHNDKLYTITDPNGKTWQSCGICWDRTMQAAATQMIRTGQFSRST